MTEYGRKTVATSNSETASRSQHAARKPFPFHERAHHLAEEFSRPFLRDLADSDGPGKGLDPTGWAICRFMREIANFQAARLARIEMLGKDPPEAPWIYRDLYQIDWSDRERQVFVRIPVDAMPHFHRDGLTWFLSWQTALGGMIGKGRMLGRRPKGLPELSMISPRDAYHQLLEQAA
jgi:hypothetical protein